MTARQLVSLADPVLGEAEEQALVEVIRDQWLTMGPRVAEFESAFAALHGRDGAVAVSSCTAALHLALAGLGIGEGDEVLLPSLTFVATANAVRYVGARPVFVDIESLTHPLIALSDAERKLTSKTKAVIVVHYAGYLADMQAWRAFADRHGLWLIEDAAHAPLGAGSDGLADASAYSFFTNKNMTTAEGGMLLARDENVLDRVRRMRSHGMTSLTLDRFKGHAFSYDVVELGYNYRMDELRAAMGLVQLRHLRERNACRRKLTLQYRALLADIPSLMLPFGKEHSEDCHLMPVLLPAGVDRERIMHAMRAQGVQTSIHYPPVHRFSAYEAFSSTQTLANTVHYCERELSLPLHPGLKEEDVARVVTSLRASLEEKVA